MKLVENLGEFSGRFQSWKANTELRNYPFVSNIHSPFTPLKRALPLLNLALISSAGGYIDGTEPFDLESKDGDADLREIPIVVEAENIKYAAKGYDPSAVLEDRNSLVPIDRLIEYRSSAVIGNLNDVWWSLSPWIPNARLVVTEIAPRIVERLQRYNVQAALLVPASRLCHQTLGIIARAVELAGIPTMMLSVDTSVTDRVRPPRVAYYSGEFGSVAGKPNWPEYQLRILDESLRWIESFDQPTSRKLAVDIETAVEAARGER
ncbi:MAG: glycine/sarcosine/betaine reductase selenoprotein B family protein [Pyrinomonadaceae bacterium]